MKSSSTLVVVLALVVVMMAGAQANSMPMTNTTGMPDLADMVQKMMSCIQPVRMQKYVTHCLKELYQSFRGNPNQDCPQAAMTMMPACINGTTRKCLVEVGISEAMLAMIPSNSAPAIVDANNTAMFCSGIVPFRLAQFTNCSQNYYMSLGLCVLPFQQKFNTNKGDPALCEAYDVQNTCMMAGAQANCDATEYRNISTEFAFLNEKTYNPFCSDSQVSGTAATLASGMMLSVLSVLFGVGTFW